MNLGQYIAQQLLEAEGQATIALFPGAFKPPHKGHFEVVKQLLQKADQVVILISPKTREGIDVDESVAVWNLYKTLLDGNVEIKVAEENPIDETYSVIKNNPDTNFIAAVGKGEISRYKSMSQYHNVQTFDAGNFENVNATGLRAALNAKDEQKIEEYLPKGIAVVDFLNAINNSKDKAEEPTPLDNGNQGTKNELKESLPPMEYDSPYHDLVLSQMDKIDETSEKFNLPAEDIQYALEIGHETILSDTIWSGLENSKSHDIKSLEQVVILARKRGINIYPYIDAVKSNKELPLPMIIQYEEGKYYLVAGEIVLCLYKALNVQPVVLVGNLILKQMVGKIAEEEKLQHTKLKDEQINIIAQFMKYAVKSLNLHSLPNKLTLSYDNKQAKHRHTFGYFDPQTNKVWLYVKDRNVADILRTLAHELVHRKQAEQGRIETNSGNTGSEIENEANAIAGVLLRNFGKNHEDIYENKNSYVHNLL
jgi:cytidyltransferase-like protein